MCRAIPAAASGEMVRKMRRTASRQPKLDSMRSVVTCAPTVASRASRASAETAIEYFPSVLANQSLTAARGSRILSRPACAIDIAIWIVMSVDC
eukprot:795328-Prymnesium_polylepis.2